MENGDEDTDGHVEVFGRYVSFVYTDTEAYANSWIAEYISVRYNTRLVAGLHIELENAGNPHPYVATLALCLRGRRVLIYHMYCTLRLPVQLRILIMDPANTFVGVNLQPHVWSLIYWDNFSGGNYLRGPIVYRNLGILAASRYNRPELRQADVSELALAVLGERLVLPPVNADWERPMLLNNQMVYATVNAYVAFELGRELVHEN